MALDPDFDDRVRVALAPDARAVDRMVSAALERGKVAVAGRRRRTTWRLCLAAAALLVCALFVARQHAPASFPAADDVVLTRVGDVVMIQTRTGETLILGPKKAGDIRAAGTGFVIVEGDAK